MSASEIIRLGKTEYPELIELWEASVRATHHFLSEKDILGYRQLILSTYFDQVTLFGIYDSGSIAGFIGLDGTNIQMLFISPEVRGRGFGKALVGFAREEHGAYQVDVNEQNAQAVGFYEALGFKIYDRVEYDAAGKPYPILSMQC